VLRLASGKRRTVDLRISQLKINEKGLRLRLVFCSHQQLRFNPLHDPQIRILPMARIAVVYKNELTGKFADKPTRGLINSPTAIFFKLRKDNAIFLH